MITVGCGDLKMIELILSKQIFDINETNVLYYINYLRLMETLHSTWLYKHRCINVLICCFSIILMIKYSISRECVHLITNLKQIDYCYCNMYSNVYINLFLKLYYFNSKIILIYF